MFSFFSKTPYLKEFIPTNFIDINNPFISNSFQENATINLIKNLKKIHISQAIAAPRPHQNTPKEIKNISVINEFYKGHSHLYMLEESLIEQAKLANLRPLTENYILVELNPYYHQSDLINLLLDLKFLGYKVIISNPEKYYYLQLDIKKYEKLKYYDVYFMLNLRSLTKTESEETIKSAKMLLNNEMYDFSGTYSNNESEMDQLLSSSIEYDNRKKIEQLLLKNTSLL
ncbi:MAG: hypothetical protein NTX34_07335 [Cytophagales bacterium]|nr:hypothetical protein [Cytophagales bacterium]